MSCHEEFLNVWNNRISLVAMSGDRGDCVTVWVLFSFALAARLDTVANASVLLAFSQQSFEQLPLQYH
jgi:hypothetical protein